jgi:chromosome partitioning protein
MRIYTVALEKGGVGKTALAVNLAAAFQKAGLSVLLIDLDPQASATHWLGIDPDSLSAEQSGYGVMSAAINGRAYAHHILERARPTADGVAVLPANDQMKSLPAQLSAADLGGLDVLADLLADLTHSSNVYDIVMIDLPPARGPILGMALAAATRCIIPIQAEDLVVRALVALGESIHRIRSRVNPHLHYSIVRNKYALRSGADKVLDEIIRTDYADHLFQTIIPIHAALRDSAALQQSIFRYAGPDVGKIRNLFLQLVEELVQYETHGHAQEE